MVTGQAVAPGVEVAKMPMAVMVRLFAGAAELIGVRTWYLPVGDGMTIGDAFERLCDAFPRFENYRNRLHFALNAEYAGPQTLVHRGDEVCLIPPVSGGATS
jgi:molybdopterin converting factor small subunit